MTPSPTSDIKAQIGAIQPVVEDTYSCSCITYMRELGHTFPRIPDPSFLQPNSPPVIGGLILIDHPNFPHLGEIFDFRPEVLFYKERVLIDEECYTRINWMSYDDERIRGFYKF